MDWHLRISVTPACNFSCVYCNPARLRDNRELMPIEGFSRSLRAAGSAGIRRVHWTGGEPTLINLESLVREAADAGFSEQILTTNGSAGPERLDRLVDAGVSRVIVSIDSLDAALFKRTTGSCQLQSALGTIARAAERLSTPTKINVVVTRWNLNELRAFIALAATYNGGRGDDRVVLKLIELCPNNPVFFEANGSIPLTELHVSRDELIEELRSIDEFEPTRIVGDNPNCEYVRLRQSRVSVGLVTMPSLQYPCGGARCRKLRINPWGDLGACITHPFGSIFGLDEIGIMEMIRSVMAWRITTDETSGERRHFQGRFGFWRFGACKGDDAQPPYRG